MTRLSSVHHLARGPALALAVALLVALVGPLTAMAFPTSHTVFPTYGSCTADTTAWASYGGEGEQVVAYTEDVESCATEVAVKACLMSNSFVVTCTFWDWDPYFAYQGLSSGDYYYGYGYGGVDAGTVLSTNSVHP